MYQFNCNTLLLSRSKNINGMIITVKEFPDETEKKKIEVLSVTTRSYTSSNKT